MFDVVDLGTKKGNAIVTFLRDKVGSLCVPSESLKLFEKSRCVGFERPEGEKYRKDVEGKGFKFDVADLATDIGVQRLPRGKVYLAWHFLEHLPDKQWSKKLVQAALTNTSMAAWFRLPSFEQDSVNGEGVLRNLGLRFTWTNWSGHPSHWLVRDCVEAIREWEKGQSRKFELIVKPAKYIKTTDDSLVVPISAPVDVNSYIPAYGPKPSVQLDKAIVSEWEVIVRFYANSTS